MQDEFRQYRFCYFAVEKLFDQELIGFIGLHHQTFKSDFTPCIDIGWRLAKEEWNNGFATEGAKRCLEYGFSDLKLSKIVALCPEINIKSEHIMKKAGMQKILTFEHPFLKDYPLLEKCVLYEIRKRTN